MKTKTKLFCMSMLAIFQLSAADIYVNQSGQAGTYLTISDAVAAASDGDNIYISPIAEYIEDITIDKSLTFASAETTNDYFVDGSVTVVGAPGRDVRFIKGEFESLFYNPGTDTITDKTKITLRTTTVINNINVAGHVNLELNVLYCNMPSKTLTFQFGKVIGSEFFSIEIMKNLVPAGYVPVDTTFIIGNTLNGTCKFKSAHYLFIAGNYFDRLSAGNKKTLSITNEISGGLGGNYICNNEFRWYLSSTLYPAYGMHLGFLEGGDFSNFKLYNNKFYKFYNTSSSTTYRSAVGPVDGNGNSSLGLPLSEYPDVKYNVSYVYNSSSNTIFYGYNTHSSNQTNTENYTNSGAPTIDFYDINMTRNDIGRYGGPYTFSNYNSQGGPRIYHLEMPFQLLPGETPNVKAEAVHD